MTTTLILLLYVLPMIISGLLHYFELETKTLGDFFGNLGFSMFIPLVNISYFISLIITGNYPKPNWLQRIKDIKIKIIVIFFCSFLVFSCGESVTVEISKEEYRQFKNLPPERELILGNQESCKIITASDNHEYYLQKVGMSGYAVGNIYLHYIDCQFCAKRLKTEIK